MIDSKNNFHENSFQNKLTCSICLPVFNEEECLKKFLENLFLQINFCTKQFNLNFDVIAVDDGSTDSSLEILQSYQNNEERLAIYSFEKNTGHQAAIICAMSHSKADLIITMDSDGQDPPESISKFLNTYFETGKEIIIAKRQTRKDGFLKKYTAWLFYRLIIILGLPAEAKDAGDFRLITKRVNKMLLEQPKSLQYIRGQIFMLRIDPKIIKVDRKERIAGRTKYSLYKMISLAISSVFVIDPFKVAQLYVAISLIFSLLSFLCGIVFFILKMLNPTYYSSGITTLALLILVLFTILISMLSFQSLYISVLFRSLRNEPIYLERKLD